MCHRIEVLGSLQPGERPAYLQPPHSRSENRIIELGSLIHVWIGQQSAAAIGARVAGERGEDDALVRDRIGVELRAAGLDPARVQVRITPSYVRWGQPITVQLVSRRQLAIPFLFSRDLTLISSYVGRGEVNH